ncbi:TPA: hypothetical protein QDC03_003845 [Burkholderia cepacia]|uniref:hypothetical protein n=1 Tax=Burkholderia cepacia complex TaxID=87882 RepID=UPI0011B24AE4|nr:MULTISPECIES: hypothetical protein [Burkholderia cepacia complex]HDR9508727.1 hypothetical protein [Burkholderia cepacia]
MFVFDESAATWRSIESTLSIRDYAYSLAGGGAALDSALDSIEPEMNSRAAVGGRDHGDPRRVFPRGASAAWCAIVASLFV